MVFLVYIKQIDIKQMQTKTSLFIEKAIAIHGNLYNYDKVNYINSLTKI